MYSAKQKAIRAFLLWVDTFEDQVNLQLVKSQQVLDLWNKLETRMREIRLSLSHNQEANRISKAEKSSWLDLDYLLGRNSHAFRSMDYRFKGVEANYGHIIRPAREYLQATGVQVQSISEALRRIRAYLTSSMARGSRATFDIQLAVTHISESYTKLSGTQRLNDLWHDKAREALGRPKESNGAIVYDYTDVFEADMFSDEPRKSMKNG